MECTSVPKVEQRLLRMGQACLTQVVIKDIHEPSTLWTSGGEPDRYLEVQNSRRRACQADETVVKYKECVFYMIQLGGWDARDEAC